MDTVLIGSSIYKVYGSKNQVFNALQEVSLTVHKGEFVGIMGPSGAGKTTLLNILATIDKATSGNVVIGGKNLITMNEEQLTQFRREHLGFIFQDYNLLDSLTVKENILLPLSLSNHPANEMEKRVNELSHVLGIDAILEKYPYEISGGQKQRTSAARAIIANPSLVLADEPTGALDSRSATDLLNTFKQLNRDFHSTILMVTHDAFAASYCDRVLFMKDGSLVTELVRGDKDRKEFFQQLLNTLSTLGGGSHDII
ncbi:ABC transporter ATP-binding protein [Neobacillus sp.]|uniref:ABC transporter ATP-binding protein n=1 Tax=Neobacillus sp. TaxID=2675273 RepID=UPI00289F5B6E|nr:ABC transporter ATP-binding protein [Neobacillus sp.]